MTKNEKIIIAFLNTCTEDDFVDLMHWCLEGPQQEILNLVKGIRNKIKITKVAKKAPISIRVDYDAKLNDVADNFMDAINKLGGRAKCLESGPNDCHLTYVIHKV